MGKCCHMYGKMEPNNNSVDMQHSDFDAWHVFGTPTWVREKGSLNAAVTGLPVQE